MFELNEKDSFIIEDFQNSKSFASFLPGIVGEKGIPIWAFYINRGQAISSFGIENKDSAISEFYPADKAYQYTPYQSFRTFIKYKSKEKVSLLEPFSKHLEKETIKEKMIIHKNSIELVYWNEKYGIEFSVLYYILPESPVGALVREVKIINKNKEPINIELADGIASIFPVGISNIAYKDIGNTLKSWFDVEHNNELYNFYFLRGSTEDTEHVVEINEGNFYASLVVDSDGEKIGDIIYDREIIFGNDESLTVPKSFLEHSVSELLNKEQHGTNKVSSGFTLWDGTIKSQEEIKLYTLIGNGTSREIVKNYLEMNFSEEIFNKKSYQAHMLAEELVEDVKTKTGRVNFDGYVSQMYFDNGLRGGFPKTYSYDGKKKTYYMYSRKHGDLERDYNFFSTSPTYYSQGNGNYRDINQNRRMDVVIHPEVEDYNISHFINLIQLDGYNPLEINKVTYNFKENLVIIKEFIKTTKDCKKVEQFFLKEFEPGSLLDFILTENIELSVSFDEFLGVVLNNSEENLNSNFSEGYWIDHWTYNLDLIDSYLEVYPDRIKELFFEKYYKFYNNEAYVKPRAEKYQYKEGKLGQYDALTPANIKTGESKWIKTNEGELLQVNLFSKLLLLAAIKTATIAPYGYGIQMEAGRPGWNDALNGLPGLFGSSTSELYELKRLLRLLNAREIEEQDLVAVPTEAHYFIEKLCNTIKEYFNLSMDKDQLVNYWDKTSTELEVYRETIYKELSSETSQFNKDEVTNILNLLQKVVDYSIQEVEKTGNNDIVPTYFYFEIEQDKENYQIKAIDVAPFLEGNVKKMKLSQSLEETKQLYRDIRNSEIFDEKLKMYKTSVSTINEPQELGRIRSFTRGWLENESVFLHMENKYLLEILKAGLYEEFYEDIETMLIPFLDPKIYGRNILENSTFIASSANPDPLTHGRGYVARLSGSTVEFLNIWKEMFIGSGPYKYDSNKNELIFYLSPRLKHEFFDEEGNIQFKLFSQIEVTYKNPMKSNTFGINGVSPKKFIVTYNNGNQKIIEDHEIQGQIAKDIRDLFVRSIEVELA